MFPQRLDAPEAYAIAQAMMHGFNQHYRMFSAEAARAKQRFETWTGGPAAAQRERIEFYDLQVVACMQRLEEEFAASLQSMAVWQQVKLHYIGLMVDHLQPELAETFFNSVTTKSCTARISRTTSSSCGGRQHRIPGKYRARCRTTYRLLPRRSQAEGTLQTCSSNCSCNAASKTCSATCTALRAIRERLALTLRANFQIQVLSSLFYRNKGAYLVGKIITGYTELPLAIPILHGEQGSWCCTRRCSARTTCMRCSALRAPTSWWTWKCPAPMCSFLRSLMPRKPGPRSITPWVWPSRARRCSTATFCTICAIPATSSALRRHQGHGHAGVRPAELSLCVQAHQGSYRQQQGNHARAGQGQVPAGQAA
jgi:isocitrate dehydrogenase kinase/phosphatase